MSYQLLINGNTALAGDVGIAALLIILGLGVVAILIDFIWHKLRENEKLKYEFVTIIAHKFRTPLTQIKWLLENLISGEQDSFKKENYTEIQKANEGLIKMTGSLVEITDSDAASESGYSLKRTDLCEMARAVSNREKNNFHAKNLFLYVQCDPTPVFAKVDASRMEFVLETILENSIAYSKPGNDVELSVAKVKGKAVISVRDNGIGIDPGDIGRIFTKFFRTKNARKMDTEGFGVGLFLAQSVVKRHHGKITVSSPGLEKGSTFSIILPATK